MRKSFDFQEILINLRSLSFCRASRSSQHNCRTVLSRNDFVYLKHHIRALNRRRTKGATAPFCSCAVGHENIGDKMNVSYQIDQTLT